MRELLWLLNRGHSTVVCHLSLSINSMKLIFRGFFGIGYEFIKWVILCCSVWLTRENLASYKKFRKDFNEQVGSFIFIHSSAQCCYNLLPYLLLIAVFVQQHYSVIRQNEC